MSARVDAYDTIRRDTLDRIERRRLRPDADIDQVRTEVAAAVDEYQRHAHLGRVVPLHQPDVMLERVLRSITDFGPLTELLGRRDVEEIFMEGPRVSFLDSGGRLRGLEAPTSEHENRQIVDRLLAPTDRPLNAKHPIVQARVLDGTARLTAAIPPVGDRLSATVRRYTVREVTLDDLVSRGTVSAAAARFLESLMQLRSRIIISGEPGAGKTTLAAALLAAAPPNHCVRCCEEIREIAVPVTHGGYYEVRPPGVDGTGEITLRDLVKFVLAMRPDRIVVGEVRGGEAFELTRAVNAGCGFLCTVHANGAPDALHALVNAALMAGENITERVVRRVFAGGLDIVVHLERDEADHKTGGVAPRSVKEIVAVLPSTSDEFTVEPLFRRASRGAALEWSGIIPESLAARLERALGVSTRAVLDGRSQR